MKPHLLAFSFSPKAPFPSSQSFSSTHNSNYASKTCKKCQAKMYLKSSPAPLEPRMVQDPRREGSEGGWRSGTSDGSSGGAVRGASSLRILLLCARSHQPCYSCLYCYECVSKLCQVPVVTIQRSMSVKKPETRETPRTPGSHLPLGVAAWGDLE